MPSGIVTGGIVVDGTALIYYALTRRPRASWRKPHRGTTPAASMVAQSAVAIAGTCLVGSAATVPHRTIAATRVTQPAAIVEGAIVAAVEAEAMEAEAAIDALLPPFTSDNAF